MYFILTILILSVSLLYSCSNDKAQHATKSHPKEVKVALSAEVNPPICIPIKQSFYRARYGIYETIRKEITAV